MNTSQNLKICAARCTSFKVLRISALRRHTRGAAWRTVLKVMNGRWQQAGLPGEPCRAPVDLNRQKPAQKERRGLFWYAVAPCPASQTSAQSDGQERGRRRRPGRAQRTQRQISSQLQNTSERSASSRFRYSPVFSRRRLPMSRATMPEISWRRTGLARSACVI